MTLSVTHKFQSEKANGADPTQVQPSNWNDQHAITCNGSSVLGNSGVSNGPVAEIPAGGLGLSMLAAGVLADLIAAGVPIATTGDVKLTLKTVADNGWIMMNDQTIGPTGSTATYANNNAQSLYTLIWNNLTNANAPVTGGRGASAAADWTAAKPIQLTVAMGRALGLAGAGSGLTSRALGQTVGEETHTLTDAESPAHTHPGSTFTGTQQTWATNENTFVQTGPNTDNPNASGNPAGHIGQATVTITPAGTVSVAADGGGGAHNNMQPTTFLNAMIKL